MDYSNDRVSLNDENLDPRVFAWLTELLAGAQIIYDTDVLCDIANKSVPRKNVNPDVEKRLLRDGLVDIVMVWPINPLPTEVGSGVEHLQITDIGRWALVQTV